MAIYIDPAMVPDLDNIDSKVFKYLIQKHKGSLPDGLSARTTMKADMQYLLRMKATMRIR